MSSLSALVKMAALGNRFFPFSTCSGVVGGGETEANNEDVKGFLSSSLSAHPRSVVVVSMR